MTSALLYRCAADALVVAHMMYALSVILGLLLTIVGYLRGWNWIRNAWFRSIHLAMILIVVLEAWMGIACPLTVWEKQLRTAAGQASYRGDFIAKLVHNWLFVSAPPWVFVAGYSLFGLAVLATWIVAPPKWKRTGQMALL